MSIPLVPDIERAFRALYKLRPPVGGDLVRVEIKVTAWDTDRWAAKSGKVVRVVRYLKPASLALCKPADMRDLGPAMYAAVDAWKKANPAP